MTATMRRFYSILFYSILFSLIFFYLFIRTNHRSLNISHTVSLTNSLFLSLYIYIYVQILLPFFLSFSFSLLRFPLQSFPLFFLLISSPLVRFSPPAMVRPLAKEAGKLESREAILQHYVYLVRENLHIVLCMSPIGAGFRTRCRMFPSLVSKENNEILLI